MGRATQANSQGQKGRASPRAQTAPRFDDGENSEFIRASSGFSAVVAAANNLKGLICKALKRVGQDDLAQAGSLSYPRPHTTLISLAPTFTFTLTPAPTLTQRRRRASLPRWPSCTSRHPTSSGRRSTRRKCSAR